MTREGITNHRGHVLTLPVLRLPRGGRGEGISRGLLDGRGDAVGRMDGGLRDRLVEMWERVDLEAWRYRGGRVTDMEEDVVLGRGALWD